MKTQEEIKQEVNRLVKADRNVVAVYVPNYPSIARVARRLGIDYFSHVSVADAERLGATGFRFDCWDHWHSAPTLKASWPQAYFQEGGDR